MRFIVTVTILGFALTSLTNGESTLLELIDAGIKAAKTHDVEKLEKIFPRASKRPWSEFKKIVETVGERTPVEQLMASSLVAYSPYVEKALATFRDHKEPEVRLCVLSAAVERYVTQGRKLEANDILKLRELTKSDNVLVAARGLFSLMAVTTSSDPKYDSIRERIHKKLTEIKEPDQFTKEFTEHLKQRPPKIPNDEQEAADRYPTTK